jgi:hypothetical protein
MASNCKRPKIYEDRIQKWNNILSAERELKKTKLKWRLEGFLEDPTCLARIERFLDQMELSQGILDLKSSEQCSLRNLVREGSSQVTPHNTMPDPPGEDVCGSTSQLHRQI